uniref:Myosin motor domain-containing protein n=1 Tax=Mucochytrium quahogii TaxID=96639 RepID=A0A7S2WSN5_9STRA|mmetsp:Transcript_44427/g.71197  ORF Transcript_44427/g.71197 Transcript_44427/m.71197 type:complete len:1304 (-) Transcript_44427:2167-6078(-)|eukprot:CAMPEP_0203764314 /NCGR_PEP_ID=MMETSP0098-20131031/17599_1 /ASSEMBLY_ACC=CAM_ASM_000208 /TAXON_ID=96639 /ORGANISM=" , Strain NY0313808BC1" /LENGTH=1303 /DNA_ID=CAMNT_0050660121 /DNA_START=187 /DNA_END=4098 /DNA_ORIENTATION=+
MADPTGTKVWVRDKKRSWAQGTLEERYEEDGKYVFVVRKIPVEDGDEGSDYGADDEEEEVTKVFGESSEISNCKDLYLCNQFENGQTLSDIEDLTWLTHLHEPSILQSLSERFDRDLIYTNTGPILLAVNPFKHINLYSPELLEMYYSTGLLKAQGLEAPSLAPHVYAMGDNAYRSLVDNTETQAKNQSILVSGESGAGKTESTKFIMKYLATVACDENDKEGQKIADMVLQSNPILEAFGNARTNRNDNSSRFGKFIEMQFNKKGMLVGARIVTYLLEKVRLAKQGLGERNFHVFYQLCKGASHEQLKNWHVPTLEDCNLTNQSDCYERKDHVDDDDQFAKMWEAMEVMGFPNEEKVDLMRITSAVMNLGNLEFVEDGEGSCVSDDSHRAVQACMDLLGVEESALQTALTTRNIKVGAESVTKPLTVEEAENARDALAKTIYSRMFDRVVKRVNESIQVNAKIKTNFIGVLDIFGFEVFETNSFEQLCINYANETLQQQFNQFVFKLEQKEYEKEKIKWSFIDFPDNQKCLDLIEAKPIGILSLLDEQCLFPKGNDKSLAGKFYEKLDSVERFSVSNKERVNLKFTVEHYAGDVCYDTEGFVAKNKDQLYEESLVLMKGSKSSFVVTLFTDKAVSKAAAAAAKKGGAGGKSIQSKTVGTQFKDQLTELLKTIRSTSPHYIRCLKPNDKAAAGVIVRQRLVDQLRYGGVLEAVKVARAGYPVRMVLAEFVTRYFMLQQKMDVAKARKDSDGRPAALKIVEGMALEPEVDYQVGRTKLFLRKGAYEKMEEARIARMKDAATKIQAVSRAKDAVKQYAKLSKATKTLQKIIRGFIGRCRAKHARNARAAVILQASARRLVARMQWRKTMRSLKRMQREYRAYRRRVWEKANKRDRSILCIQAWKRGQPARTEFLQKRRAITVVQTCARGKLAREMRKRLRIEARQVGNLQQQLEDLKARVKQLEEELEAEKAAHALALGAAGGTVAAAAVGDGVIQGQLDEANATVKRQQEKIEQLEAGAMVAGAAIITADELDTLRETLAETQRVNAQQQAKLEELQGTLNGATLATDSNGTATTGASDEKVAELEEQIRQLQADLENEKKSKIAVGALGAVGTAAGVGAAVASGSGEHASAGIAPAGSVASSAGAASAQEVAQEVQSLHAKIHELETQLAQSGAGGNMGAAAAAGAGVAGSDALAAKVANLEKENKDIQIQIGSYIEKMCDAENRANEIQNDYVKLRKTNKNLQDKMDAMELLAQQASGVKIALAKRLESLILENRTLRQDQTDAEELVGKLQQENQILKSRV